jgi:hypothetical protein
MSVVADICKFFSLYTAAESRMREKICFHIPYRDEFA